MLNTVAQLKYPTHFTGSVAGLSLRYKWQDEMSKNIVFGGNIKMNLEKQMMDLVQDTNGKTKCLKILCLGEI
jgi:hypothetical protein